MSAPDHASRASPLALLPHQAAFRDTVFNPSDRRLVLLRADPGFGKLAAFVAVAREQIIRNPESRVLFLVPAALAHQVAERLRSEGVLNSRIDRFRFRELLDTSDGDEIWPRGAVSILSRDFANQTDVQKSLSQTYWDLVIADEVHHLSAARAASLRNLISTAGKVVLGTATPVEGELDGIVTPEAPHVVTWHRDMMVDEHGRSLAFAPRPKLRFVPYSASSAEDQVRETVNALCATLDRTGEWRKLIAHTLRCHLDSSLAALERVLRRIKDGRVQFDFEVEKGLLGEAEGVDATEYWRADPAASDEIKLLVDRALQQIESTDTDAKLAVFAALIERLHGHDGRDRRICVVTNYVATLYYVAAEIEGRRIPYYTFHGGMALDMRTSAVESFCREGGILLVTTAAIPQSVNLADVSDLVLFDVPPSRLSLQQVLGHFDRFGRKDQLTVHALAFSRASEEVAQGLAMLQTMLDE